MHRVLLLALSFLAFGGGVTRPATPRPVETRITTPQKPSFRVVAYLPDYPLATLQPAAVRNVTDLIYFSLEPTATGDLNTARITPGAWQRLHTLQAIARFHLMVAVGGWGQSGGFAPVTASPQLRAHFILALVQYCRQNRLEGVDFDWEGPANATEEAHYAALLIEAKRAFQRYRYRLTVAMAASQHMPPNGIAAVDAFHLMAYDHDGRHSTFDQARADVAFLRKQGVPKSKVILGCRTMGMVYRTGIPQQPMPTSWHSIIHDQMRTRRAASSLTAPKPSRSRHAMRWKTGWAAS